MRRKDKETRRSAARAQAAAQAEVRWKQDRDLARLKERLLQAWLEETDNPRLRQRLAQAATEAESLAWTTPFPLLVLPALAEEKMRSARVQLVRQNHLRDTSRDWLALSE
jgi:hypothetical protein